jgi:DNA-binding MarR family transcriptional regulator
VHLALRRGPGPHAGDLRTASRVVARLEEEELAVRKMCPDDRRGIFATVTGAGRERLAEAAPTYRRVITEKLGGA